ncbi:MAG: O-methyltransferase [Bacteroidetes bacterium]|nr:O-methyltransferase [Bacteroidota bacterium]
MIPEEIERYCELHSSPESQFLADLNRETHLTQVYPRMISGPMQGTLLRLICSMIRPAKVLEIGTFTGYSTINFALGSEAVIHSIEVNPELENIIRRYLKEAAIENRVRLHFGEALKVIPELHETWDLVYIDADKPNYLNYYQLVFPMVRQGGWIIADNALWDGKVLSANSADKDTLGIISYNEFVQKDKRVENLLLPFRDGLMIARKL